MKQATSRAFKTSKQPNKANILTVQVLPEVAEFIQYIATCEKSSKNKVLQDILTHWYAAQHTDGMEVN